MSQNLEASRSLAAEYSAAATAYARHWAPVIHPMAVGLLEALPLAPARRVLDLGCGTGTLFDDLHSRAPSAHLIGGDRAEGMLRLATTTPRSSLMVTDAEDLALQDETIDIAILAFALFHAPDPVAALREVRRVLRPNGVVGIVAWGNDPGLPGTAMWAEELDACGAATDPRDPLVMGQPRMNTLERLSDLLRDADFPTARTWSQQFTRRWTVDDLLALQTGCGMPSRRLATLPRSAQAACQEKVRGRIASLPGDDLVYQTEVLYGVAHRPRRSA